ncbi:MAG: hypothetical protein ACOYKE_02495 [Ferruginibacter sp.]
MITLVCTRAETELMLNYFFGSIEYFKAAQVRSLDHLEKTAPENLMLKIFHIGLDEIELMLQKKLLITQGHKIRLKFTPVMSILFYRLLLTTPVDSNQFYILHLRNKWIEFFDKALLDML